MQEGIQSIPIRTIASLPERSYAAVHIGSGAPARKAFITFRRKI
jgi:hypothetical protein